MSDLEIMKEAFNKIDNGNFGYVEMKSNDSKEAYTYLIIAYKDDHKEILSYRYRDNLSLKWKSKSYWSFDEDGIFASC